MGMGLGRSAGDWIRRITRARYGQLLLYWFSVLEAAFVPVPFEAVLAPYMQMRPDIRWRLAAVGVAGYASVALAAYGLGALFHEAAAEPLIGAMGWQEEYDRVQERLLEGGFLTIALLVALPVPTLPVHISAGAVGVPLEYTLASVALVRGGRYFGTGVLVHLYGDRVVDWFRDRRSRRASRD